MNRAEQPSPPGLRTVHYFVDIDRSAPRPLHTITLWRSSLLPAVLNLADASN